MGEASSRAVELARPLLRPAPGTPPATVDEITTVMERVSQLRAADSTEEMALSQIQRELQMLRDLALFRGSPGGS